MIVVIPDIQTAGCSCRMPSIVLVLVLVLFVVGLVVSLVLAFVLVIFVFLGLGFRCPTLFNVGVCIWDFVLEQTSGLPPKLVEAARSEWEQTMQVVLTLFLDKRRCVCVLYFVSMMAASATVVVAAAAAAAAALFGRSRTCGT